MQPLFGTLMQISTNVRAKELDKRLGQLDSQYAKNRYIRIPKPVIQGEDKTDVQDTVVFLKDYYGSGTLVAATGAEKENDLRVIAGSVIRHLAERSVLPSDSVGDLQRRFNEDFSAGRAVLDPKGSKK